MRKRYYFPQNLLTDEDGKESKIETERQILYIGLVGKKMFCWLFSADQTTLFLLWLSLQMLFMAAFLILIQTNENEKKEKELLFFG